MARRTFGTSIVSFVSALLCAGVVYAQGGPVNQGETASMMAEHKRMMADLQAGEKRLDELVAKMNASHGPDRIDQIAAVLNELVALQKRMNRGMMSMSGGMMQRMQMGPQSKGTEPAPKSPGDPAVDHEQHHPQGAR